MASLLLPVMGNFASAIVIHLLYLMVGTTLATSCTFLLPVAMPPNAIVFSRRRVTVPQTASAGIWLNLVATVVIVLFVAGLLLLWESHLRKVIAEQPASWVRLLRVANPS